MSGPGIFLGIFIGIGVLAIVLSWLAGAPLDVSRDKKRERYLLWWLTRRDRVRGEDD